MNSPMSSLFSPTSSSSSFSSSSSSSNEHFLSLPPQRRKPRVSAEHTLNRVRENQRRHRARRKDYIASLEEKLADTERQLAEARAEIAELKRARESGVTEAVRPLFCDHDDRVQDEEGKDGAMDVVEARGKGGEQGMHVGFDVISAPSIATATTTTGTLALSTSTSTVPPSTETTAFLDDLSTYMASSLPDAQVASPVIPVGPPPCCEDNPTSPVPTPTPSPECSTCHSRPAPLPTESTTLCAQAYAMIQQQNFRGIDAATIRLWLYQGYRRAQREGEGCRVENGALFRLLDYISGI